MRAQRHQIHPLLAPVPGTERFIHSFHYGPAQPQGKVYIQASLHADELPGMLVAWHLKQRLAELQTAGRLRSEIVIVPVASSTTKSAAMTPIAIRTTFLVCHIATASGSGHSAPEAQAGKGGRRRSLSAAILCVSV